MFCKREVSLYSDLIISWQNKSMIYAQVCAIYATLQLTATYAQKLLILDIVKVSPEKQTHPDN